MMFRQLEDIKKYIKIIKINQIGFFFYVEVCEMRNSLHPFNSILSGLKKKIR